MGFQLGWHDVLVGAEAASPLGGPLGDEPGGLPRGPGSPHERRRLRRGRPCRSYSRARCGQRSWRSADLRSKMTDAQSMTSDRARWRRGGLASSCWRTPPRLKGWSACLVHGAEAPDQRFRVRAEVEDRSFSGLFSGPTHLCARCPMQVGVARAACTLRIRGPASGRGGGAWGMPCAGALLDVLPADRFPPRASSSKNLAGRWEGTTGSHRRVLSGGEPPLVAAADEDIHGHLGKRLLGAGRRW